MEQPWFSVKNYDRFQHYRDRNPIWIKLYVALLDDYAFATLPDASKAHLVAIWLLASRYQNRIPLDREWIAARINATEPVDLDRLERAGFIIIDRPDDDDAFDLPVQKPASKPLAEPEQTASLETETETEIEEERKNDTRSARIDTPSVSAVAEAAAVSSPPVIADVLWSACLPYLTSNGVPDRQARSMLGAWRKRYGAGEVLAAVVEAQKQSVSAPLPYIEATLKRRGENAPRRNPFAPAVSNLDVARMFAEEEAHRRERGTAPDPARDGRQALVAIPPAVAR